MQCEFICLFADELLLTIFKKLVDENLLSDENISESVIFFSTFTGGDYKKLKSFLQRVERQELFWTGPKKLDGKNLS